MTCRFGNKTKIGKACDNIIRMDSDGRCGVALLGEEQLVVLPLLHTSNEFNDVIEVNDTGNQNISDTTNQTSRHLAGVYTSLVQQPFLLPLKATGITGRILDMAFLSMMVEPALMILHETMPSCTGRFAAGRDTTCLTVLSLNVTQEGYPTIWSAAGLPLNATKIVPVPAPLGGALVLCTNAILYFNQTQYAGLALNPFFGSHTINTLKYPLETNPEPLSIQVDVNTQVSFVSYNEVLLCLGDGDLVLLTLQLGATSVQKMAIVELGTKTVPATCMTYLGNNTLFVGSQTGDSLVIAYDRGDANVDEDKVKIEKENENSKNEMENKSAKRQKISTVDDEDDDFLLYGSLATDKDDDDLYTNDDSKHNNLSSSLSSQLDENGKSKSHVMTFRILDSLVNLGQITDFTKGVSFIAEEEDSSSSAIIPLHDLVTCGGFGRSGNVSVCHRGLRPIVGTEADLKGCRAMWTVKTGTKEEDHSKEGVDPSDADAYLILSMGSTTMILSTAGDEMELVEDAEGFFTAGATLCAGNLFCNERVVQVYRSGIRILQGLKCTQELTTEDSVEDGGLGMGNVPGLIITLVDILDPYVLLALSDGTLRLITGDPADMDVIVEIPTLKKNTTNTKGVSSNDVTSASLFYDTSGIFEKSNMMDKKENESNTKISEKTDEDDMEVDNNDDDEVSDDDDDFLYGSKTTSSTSKPPPTTSSSDKDTTISDPLPYDHLKVKSEINSKVYCAVCRASGSLEIYALPSFEFIIEFPEFAFGPSTLCSASEVTTRSTLGLLPENGNFDTSHGPAPEVADVTIHRIGPERSLLHSEHLSKMVLVALLTSGDVLVYSVCCGDPDKPMVFHRMENTLITRPLVTTAGSHPGTKSNNSSKSKISSENNKNKSHRMLKNVFRYPMFAKFININGRSGIFFRGLRPCWFLCDRGTPQVVLMEVPKSKKGVPVLCFTPFHSTSSPHGFIYFHSSGVLRVCQLPAANEAILCDDSTSSMIIRKMPLKCTPHTIVYLGSTGSSAVAAALAIPTYAVVVSNAVRWAPGVEEEEDIAPEGDEYTEINQNEKPKELLLLDTLENVPILLEEIFSIRLVTGDLWNMAGIFQVDMNRYERICSMKLVYLSDTSCHSIGKEMSSEWKKRRMPYLVLGTGYATPDGEDGGGRGRIVLYEIDYAQYTDASGVAGRKMPKLKFVYEKEHRTGSISAVAQMGPYVLATIGAKIIVHEFKSEQLVGCAFYDGQFYITSMNTCREYVLYGDVYKSVHFLHWNEIERSLTLLAKDFNPLNVTATEFSISENQLGLVASDIHENISIFHYAPDDVASRGGQALIRRNDFHTGVSISAMHRFRIPKEVLPSSKSKNRFVTIMGSTTGGLTVLVPTSERVFRRLFTLQTIMSNALQSHGGGNPREFRRFRNHSGNVESVETKNGVLDGKSLLRFCSLDLISQNELSRCIGTSPEVVLQNLLEIQLSGTFL